jgi:Family of unknown function (DUF6356)
MFRASKEHLADVDEGYFAHMQFALLVAVLAVGAGLACGIHAIVPGLCPQTCSRTIASLQWMFTDRSTVRDAVSQNSTPITLVVLSAVLCAAAFAARR